MGVFALSTQCNFYCAKTNIDFWTKKFDENVLRDERNHRSIHEIGWQFLAYGNVK